MQAYPLLHSRRGIAQCARSPREPPPPPPFRSKSAKQSLILRGGGRGCSAPCPGRALDAAPLHLVVRDAHRVHALHIAVPAEHASTGRCVACSCAREAPAAPARAQPSDGKSEKYRFIPFFPCAAIKAGTTTRRAVCVGICSARGVRIKKLGKVDLAGEKKKRTRPVIS